MDASKKQRLSCPVCDDVFENEEIELHVNSHFGENHLEKCQYPACGIILTDDTYADHLLAHESSNGNIPDDLDDSTVARLIQEDECDREENTGKNSDQQIQDQLLARKLEQEEKYNQEQIHFKKLQEQYGMSSNSGGYVKQYEKQTQKKVGKSVNIGDYFKEKADVMGALVAGEDTCKTRTQGVIPAIGAVYTNQSKKKICYMCNNTDHFSGDVPDKGYGCGFRNFQMLLSSLMKIDMYKNVIALKFGNITMPSIPFIQTSIENAWKEGYDTAGCRQLSGKLSGTRKWIGTTEVAALLRWMKIRARIVDFHKPTGPDKTNPELFNWIESYFKDRNSPWSSSSSSSSTSATKSPPFPLYLQHHGHSRTCIGIEKNLSNNTLSLLIFDPSCKSDKMKQLKEIASTNKTLGSIQSLKRPLTQMKYDQYQILYIDGIYEDKNEIQESKLIASTRIP